MPKKKASSNTRIHKQDNKLSQRMLTNRWIKSAFAKTRTLLPGMVRHMVMVQPATSFDFRYESSGGNARVIHLERGALELEGGNPPAVTSFRAVVYPGDNPTQGAFYTSPNFIPMIAQAHILIENGIPGDSIICRSYGSSDGLKVTLSIYRETSSGSIGQILKQEIQDADEHKFLIP